MRRSTFNPVHPTVFDAMVQVADDPVIERDRHWQYLVVDGRTVAQARLEQAS